MRLQGKIEEIEYDVLDLSTSPNNYHQKNFQQLSHLSDATPFAFVEICVKKLCFEDKIISEQTYRENLKPI